MREKAPVKEVGQSKGNGVWPADLEEIAVGKEYNRQVRMEDGILQDVPVKVNEIRDVGPQEKGYAVTYQYDSGDL